MCKVTPLKNHYYYYFLTGMGEKYCDHRVCVSVCLFVCLSVRSHISNTARAYVTKFFSHVIFGRGSVLVWWHCDVYFRFCG